MKLSEFKQIIDKMANENPDTDLILNLSGFSHAYKVNKINPQFSFDGLRLELEVLSVLNRDPHRSFEL